MTSKEQRDRRKMYMLIKICNIEQSKKFVAKLEKRQTGCEFRDVNGEWLDMKLETKLYLLFLGDHGHQTHHTGKMLCHFLLWFKAKFLGDCWHVPVQPRHCCVGKAGGNLNVMQSLMLEHSTPGSARLIAPWDITDRSLSADIKLRIKIKSRIKSRCCGKFNLHTAQAIEAHFFLKWWDFQEYQIVCINAQTIN